jgi:cytoskeletal protein CcmA (bactofilin family)
MFGRKKNKTIEDNDISLVQGTSPESALDIAPKPVEKVEKTVIGKHIFIEGNIRGEEYLLIEGSMKGVVDIPEHNFHLGVNGHFEGEIHALNVNISGQMEGEIKSIERVVITKDASFQGAIETKTISLEDGAYFKGSIELEQRSKANAAGNKSDVTIGKGKYTQAMERAPKKSNAADKTIDTPLQQLDPDQKPKSIVETKNLNRAG